MTGIEMSRTHWRLVVCLVLMYVAADYLRSQMVPQAIVPDIGQVWFAAKAVLRGDNPYALIGPHRPFAWEAPLFYPLPAALLAVPLTPLSEGTAAIVFTTLGVGVLAWTLTEHGWGGLWGMASLCVQQAVLFAQWSPLLAGATVLAPLSIILVAKPTVGAAVFAARPTRWAIVGATVLALIAFLVQPDWVSEWRHALSAASVGAGARFPYLMPIAQPGGMLVLLALSRWRRPEARLLVALACVPQTMLPYEGVLLFLVPRGWRQALTLTLMSWAARAYVHTVLQPHGQTEIILAWAPTMTLLLYLPCVVMVLRRPNEGTVPAWLDRRIRAWPAWLRGSTVANA